MSFCCKPFTTRHNKFYGNVIAVYVKLVSAFLQITASQISVVKDISKKISNPLWTDNSVEYNNIG